jgi:hypothetical protein
VATIRELLDAGTKFYDIDRVLYHSGLLEIHFGNFRAQAEAAEVIVRQAAVGMGITDVEISYGADPCA